MQRLFLLYANMGLQFEPFFELQMETHFDICRL